MCSSSIFSFSYLLTANLSMYFLLWRPIQMNFLNITHLNTLFAGYRWGFYHEDSIIPARALWGGLACLAEKMNLTKGQQPVEAVCSVTEGKELPQPLVSVLTLPSKCFRKHLFCNTSARISLFLTGKCFLVWCWKRVLLSRGM